MAPVRAPWRRQRVAIAGYLFFTRGFEAVFASVVAHNAVMIAYLRSAGYELLKRSRTASRSDPGGPPIEVLVFRLTKDHWLTRNGSWPAALRDATTPPGLDGEND